MAGRTLIAAVLLCLVVAVPCPTAAITCGQVVSYLGPCLGYVQGKGTLTPGCCGGVRGLNGAAQTTPDRQQVCTCLKNLAGSFPAFNPGLAAGLPGKCGVSVPIPISPSVDCSKVH